MKQHHSRFLRVLSANIGLTLALTSSVVPVLAQPFSEGRANLRLTISDDRVFAEPGEILQYRIALRNTGTSVGVTDIRLDLPSQLLLQTVSGQHQKDGGRIIWDNTEVAPGETREFVVTATIEREVPDFFAIRVRVAAGPLIASDTTSVGHEAIQAAALYVSLTDGRDTVRSGEALGYDILLENRSDRVLPHINVTATVPTYTDFEGASDGGIWRDNAVHFEEITLPPRGTRVLHYDVRVHRGVVSGQPLRAGARAGSSEAHDVTIVDGEVAVPSLVGPLLRKTADRRELAPGGLVTYTIVVRNNTTETFRNVMVTDEYDSNLIRAVDPAGSVATASTMKWSVPVIEPGNEWVIRYRMMINPQAIHAVSIRNVATVTGDGLALIAPGERQAAVTLGVLRNMPRTGVGLDGLFVLLSGSSSLLGTLGMRRRFII